MSDVLSISNQKKQSFILEEGSTISTYIREYRNFRGIQYKLPHRSLKQIRDHYNNYLNPSLNYAPFTEEEDNLKNFMLNIMVGMLKW
jgi:hypothetical protein